MTMIIMHGNGNGIILSWTSCTTCMTSFYDFISLQTPDCRLFFHWLNSDWTDSQVLLQMMVTIRWRRGRQLRQQWVVKKTFWNRFDLKTWRSCHFFWIESHCIHDHDHHAWQWQWHNSVMNFMHDLHDFILWFHFTADSRLQIVFSLTELWLDWLSGLAADDGDDSMAQRQTTQTTDVIRCDVSTDVSSSSSSWDLLVIDVIVPNCGAIKWFTYRSLHSLMNLMQLWHSWQLTLANGIMDNHGIDSTWQWIDSWKLEVGNWNLMTSWHHSTLRWSPTVVLARDSWLGFGIRDILLFLRNTECDDWWLMTQCTRHSCDDVLFDWSSNKTLS